MAVSEGKTEEVPVRTSVLLDKDLLREAMKLTGITTKRGVLAEALRLLVQVRTQERIWELRGTVDWQGDLDEMRKSRFLEE